MNASMRPTFFRGFFTKTIPAPQGYFPGSIPYDHEYSIIPKNAKLYIPNKIKINKIDAALKHFFIFSPKPAIFKHL